MYTVGLYTLGCKVSQYETEAIAEGYISCGVQVCPFEEVNDIYVINTCTVTAESDRKSRQVIRRALRKNPNAVICVVGCYSQRSYGEIAKIEGVDIIVGTDNKMSVIDLSLERVGRTKGEVFISVSDVTKSSFEPMRITRAPRTRAYVKIEDGCEAKCTYCAISDARGRVRSKARLDVIDEVVGLAEGGIREIVLTGIETGSYGKDFEEDYTLADLIVELDSINACERIRLGSLAPELVGESFCEKIKNVKILAPHFHISMQSGSDNILRLMKRRYTVARAIENIDRLKKAFPGAMITTDLMVGFPGESEEDFLLSCEFVRKVGLLDAHVFAYSKRDGTPAKDYQGQLPENVKRERSERLISVVREVRDSILDRVVEVKEPLSLILETRLDDGLFSAHSASYIEARVLIKDSLYGVGDMVWGIPVSHKDGIVYCELQK